MKLNNFKELSAQQLADDKELANSFNDLHKKITTQHEQIENENVHYYNTQLDNNNVFIGVHELNTDKGTRFHFSCVEVGGNGKVHAHASPAFHHPLAFERHLEVTFGLNTAQSAKKPSAKM